MLPLLTAANEEVRQSAAAAMKNVVHRCLQGSELEEQQLQAFARLEAGLGALHQESWPAVLSGGLPRKESRSHQGPEYRSLDIARGGAFGQALYSCKCQQEGLDCRASLPMIQMAQQHTHMDCYELLKLKALPSLQVLQLTEAALSLNYVPFHQLSGYNHFCRGYCAQQKISFSCSDVQDFFARLIPDLYSSAPC